MYFEILTTAIWINLGLLVVAVIGLTFNLLRKFFRTHRGIKTGGADASPRRFLILYPHSDHLHNLEIEMKCHARKHDDDFFGRVVDTHSRGLV